MDHDLLPPLPPPVSLPLVGSDQRFAVNRVFCLGRNYRWGDSPAAAGPLFYFMKPASAVIEAQGEIPYPPHTEAFCHEVELVVALSHGGTNIPVERALEHVWGYAVGLDMTRRDLQLQAKAEGAAWEAAKAFDGAAPIGPLHAVTRCGHPQRGAIWLRVDGQPRQQGDLQDMLRPVAEALSELSEYVTLQPGDLLMTGTPPGVDRLAPGALIEAGIAGLGELRVRVGTPARR